MTFEDIEAERHRLHSAGVKHDKDKPRWGLAPFRALGSVVDVLTYGAKKYAPENWRKVPGWRWRYTDAAFRHLSAYASRSQPMNDEESGLPHLAHAACCILFLLEQEMNSAPNGNEP